MHSLDDHTLTNSRNTNTIILLPSKCRNLGILDRFKRENTNSIETAGTKLIFLQNLSWDFAGIQQCDKHRCVVFKMRLQSIIPRCKSWEHFEGWALQAAACLCAQNAEIPSKEFKFQVKFVSMADRDYREYIREYNAEWASTVRIYDVLSILSWLNEITTQSYNLVQELNEVLQLMDDKDEIITDAIEEAVKRAVNFGLLCPVDQLVRLVNWATFLVQYVNIYQLINWAAIDKWQMTYSQYY